MKNENLIFMHLPKNGGTTFNQILNRNFRKEETFSIKTITSDTSNLSDFLSLGREEKARIKLLKGHMVFGLHQYLDGPSRYVTMLRDPVKRIISYYNYVKDRPDHHVGEYIRKNKFDLRQFAESAKQGDINNAQVRMISGIDGDETEMLEKALHNIKNHFGFVGFLEEFEASVILFAEAFKIKYPYYVRLNKSHGKDMQQNDKTTLDIIRELNKADIDLYQLQYEKFKDQVNSFKGFDYAFLKLRSLNNLYQLYLKTTSQF